MTGAGDSEADEALQALESSCEEAQKSLEGQMQIISDIDTKAIRIFRANIFLIGVLVSTLSVASKLDVGIEGLINVHTTVGFLFLLGSTISAALTYAGTSLQVGIGHDALQSKIDQGHSEVEHFRKLAKGYVNWLHYNDMVIGINAFFSTATIALAINAISTFSLGAVVILNNESTGFYTGFWKLVALLVVLAGVDLLVYLIDKAIAKVHKWEQPYQVGDD